MWDTVTIDSKGRIVLPKELRERLDLTPGTEVIVREQDGEVVVDPVDDPETVLARMERLVAETAPEQPDTTALDESDPIAHEHREAVRKGARRGDE